MNITERLAVIESRLQDILGHILEIRGYVPSRVVENSERLSALDRTLRSVVWGIALVGGGMLSAFVAHVLGGGR